MWPVCWINNFSPRRIAPPGPTDAQRSEFRERGTTGGANVLSACEEANGTELAGTHPMQTVCWSNKVPTQALTALKVPAKSTAVFLRGPEAQGSRSRNFLPQFHHSFPISALDKSACLLYYI